MLPPHLHKALLHLGVEGLDVSVLAYEEAALLHDDLRGPLGVHAEAPRLQGHDGAHGLPCAVEGVHFAEPGVGHLLPQLQQHFIITSVIGFV